MLPVPSRVPAVAVQNGSLHAARRPAPRLWPDRSCGVRPMNPRRWLLGLALGLLAGPVAANDPKDPLLKLQGHTTDVTTVAFHPDGKHLASASSTDVRVWELATGKQVW